ALEIAALVVHEHGTPLAATPALAPQDGAAAGAELDRVGSDIQGTERAVTLSCPAAGEWRILALPAGPGRKNSTEVVPWKSAQSPSTSSSRTTGRTESRGASSSAAGSRSGSRCRRSPA